MNIKINQLNKFCINFSQLIYHSLPTVIVAILVVFYQLYCSLMINMRKHLVLSRIIYGKAFQYIYFISSKASV